MNTAAAHSRRLITAITLVIQAWLAVGLIFFIVRRDWENVFLTLTVIGLIVVPAFVLRRNRVHVPPEFQLIAVVFVFLSLFLGSARDFYYRFTLSIARVQNVNETPEQAARRREVTADKFDPDP